MRRIRRIWRRLYQYFIPGAHNRHAPHFLRRKTVVAVAAIVAVLFLCALAVERILLKSGSPQMAAVVASVLVQITNDKRQTHGLDSLTVNPMLEYAAAQKANDMAEKGYFAHDSPDGKTPWHWFEEAGYDYLFAGENLAVYFSDSIDVAEAWMKSPPHRANILNSHFTEIGIAAASGVYEGRETVFVVQMFGNLSREPHLAVVEDSDASPEQSAIETDAEVSREDLSLNDSSVAVQGAAVEGVSHEVIMEDETFIAVKRTDARGVLGAVASDKGAVSPATDSAKQGIKLAWKYLTSPQTVLRVAYMAITMLVVLTLALMVSTQSGRRRRRHIFHVLALLALMAGLLYVGAYIPGQLIVL